MTDFVPGSRPQPAFDSTWPGLLTIIADYSECQPRTKTRQALSALLSINITVSFILCVLRETEARRG